MWLWVGSLPIAWFFGIPFSGVFTSTLFLFGSPSVQLVLAMVVVLASTSLLARKALNY
jgi:hypothetical protein